MLYLSQRLESDIINSRKESRKREKKGYQTGQAKRKQAVSKESRVSVCPSACVGCEQEDCSIEAE